MELQIGDIVVVHGTSLIGLGIEMITHSYASHVAIVVDPKNEQLIEADGFRTVGYQLLNEYRDQSLILRHPSITSKQQADIVSFLQSHMGDSYDYLAILQEFERYVLHVPPQEEREGVFICSTLVSHAYLHAGIRLTDTVLPSPDDILESNQLIQVGRY
jgi:uncharacterized protein YycO